MSTSSRSSSRSSSAASNSEPLRTLRNLYTQAARAFITRSTALPGHFEKAFALLSPPSEHDSAKESAALDQQRIKWEVLRLTWEASVYTLSAGAHGMSNGHNKGKERENGHHLVNGNGKGKEREMDMLSLPPAALLPALHARSLVLFTPSTLKASSTHLPAEVLLALALFAVKLNAYIVARDWVERWWVVRGSEDMDVEDEDESKGRRKIRECMTLRILPGMKDWESARGWANGEADPVLREQLLTSLETLKTQAEQDEVAQSQMSTSAYGASRISLPPSPAPTSSQGTPTPSPSRTPPPRPFSPASSTSSAATHSTHTATPATPQPARAGLILTPTGTVRALRQPSDTNTAMPIPPSAPPIAEGVPKSPNLIRALLRQMRESFSPVGWLFIVLIPLIALVIRLRTVRPRGRRLAQGNEMGAVGGAVNWLWRAVVDAVDMAGRGLV